MMLITGLVAARTLGGKGAWLMIGGALAAILTGGFWILNSLSSLLGFGFLQTMSAETMITLLQALGLLNGVGWAVAVFGVLLEVLLIRAMIQRSEVLREIRVERERCDWAGSCPEGTLHISQG
ncbi:MAG: hypothetical protein O3A92_10960 [Verrucomicrobia bacterium]|nr:hypothetical protein [Verrucomicrobiota bacterium]